MAVLIEAREATHDVAMKVDAPMVHRTWDVPVVRRTGGQWTDEAGGREIATRTVAKVNVRDREIVPEAGKKATVLMLAADHHIAPVQVFDPSLQ